MDFPVSIKGVLIIDGKTRYSYFFKFVIIIQEFCKNNSTYVETSDEIVDYSETLEEISWHQQLHKILLTFSPSAFERLTQRLLRESGFIQVEVTGKSGDGGIDGVGIARINGFFGFPRFIKVR